MKGQRTQAQIAFNNRPTRYRVDTSATQVLLARQETPDDVQCAWTDSPTTGINNSIIQQSEQDRNIATLRPMNGIDTTESAAAEGSPAMMQHAKARSQLEATRKVAPQLGVIRTTQRRAHTAETAFAETVEAARSTQTSHNRSSRRSTAPTSYSESQAHDINKDTDMTETGTTPTPEEL